MGIESKIHHIEDGKDDSINKELEYFKSQKSEEVKKVKEVKGLLGRIRDTFKEFIQGGKSDEKLIASMKQDLEFTEKEATVEGVNFSRCQMDRIAVDYNSGKSVEYESFSPYLADYNLHTGEIWSDKLTESDIIGLEVAKTLRSEFPKARMISLYDEYNTNMPDTSNERGMPVVGGPQLTLPESTKINFKNNIEQLLADRGIISQDKKECEEYLLVSESSKIKAAEELVKQLEAVGYIDHQGESINFINPEAENPAYRKIQLRTKNGRWLCEALDASSYLNPENLAITHLVVLPNHFKEQQDKVWEVLRVLGIKPDNYHNIFYDEKIDPKKVAEVIKNEIVRCKGVVA